GSLRTGVRPRAYEIVNTLHKMVRPEEILKRLFQFTVVMSDAMEEDLARRGLTRARATLLAYLRDQGPTIQSELARALRVSPRNVTGLVNGLEASGLVRRSPHPTDGRAALVELTDDGAHAAAALARDEREFAQYLFADRTTDELDTLAVGLDQLLACLSDPEYSTLRRSALRRWPLATKTGRATRQRR
ncbi:MAG TPA: MarR family transcriptional regulator, partial [Actinomycetes bacterium]